MKCPKCGYISFDYNTRCPKCNKDIAQEQEKMNFPPFKPAPPFLLESLIGEATDSSPALKVVRQNKAAEAGGDSDLSEPNALDKSDSAEIQEINIASYNSNEPQEQSFSDLELPSDSSPSALNLDQSNDGISFDLDNQKGSANLEDMSLDLDQSTGDIPNMGDKEDLSLDADPLSTKKTANEIDLKLDDFSLNEADSSKPAAKKTKSSQKLSLDDISADVDLDDEDLSIDLENLDLDLDLDTPEK